MRLLLVLLLASLLAFFLLARACGYPSKGEGGAQPAPVERDVAAPENALVQPSGEQASKAIAAPGQTRSRARADAPKPVGKTARPSPPRIVVLVLDPSAAPLADTTIKRTFGRKVTGITSSVHTDGKGVARFPVPPRVRNSEGVWLRLSWQDDRKRVAASAGRLIPVASKGTIDLGSMRLLENQVLVAGSVVEEDGTPIQRAAVSLLWRGYPQKPRKVPVQAEKWDQPNVPQTVFAAADGSFCFYSFGGEPQEELELNVKDNDGDFLALPHVPVAAGDRNVRIVLKRGRSVKGHALVDLPLAGGTDFLWVTAVRSDGSQHEQNPIQPQSSAALQMPGSSIHAPVGDFDSKRLEPGAWDIRFGFDPFQYPIHVIENVVVPADGPVDDPRLDAVDLTFLYAIRVDVVDEKGRQIGAVVRLRPAGAANWMLSTPQSADPARPGFVCGYPSVDVSVSRKGYQPVVIEGVHSDQRVVLRRKVASKER